MGTLTEKLEQQGPSLCIDDWADAWGNQIAKGSPGLAAAKSKWLLNELREAFKTGNLQVFDAGGDRERPYRASDTPELERNRVRVLPETLNAWLEQQAQPLLLNTPLPDQASSLFSDNQNSQPIKPVTRHEAQNLELLAKLRELGLDPAALSPIQPGLPGAKAAASEALGRSGIWSGSTVFNKTWERLTKTKEIQYRSSSS